MAYRVWSASANTAQLKTVVGQTGTAWSLIKTKCAVHHPIGIRKLQGCGHIVGAAVPRATTLGDTAIALEMTIDDVNQIVIAIREDILQTEEITTDDDRIMFCLKKKLEEEVRKYAVP